MPTKSNSYIRSRLALAIAQEMQKLPKQEARKSFTKLSNAYRTHDAQQITGNEQSLFLSYLAGRMLATFSVVESVLQEMIELEVQTPTSLLDLGAGPGTVAFAASSLFDFQSMTLFEKEPMFKQLATKLAQSAEEKTVLQAHWNMGDITKLSRLPDTDLVSASYSLGELDKPDAMRVASEAFAAAQIAFVVIEPGTPKGFELIRAIREQLLLEGAHVAAPCPHQLACPMQGKDFCHFSKRLAREDFHKHIKGASLGFEDEKYAYAIFTKTPATQYVGRAVKKPLLGSGHVTLDICTDGRIERKVVSRSMKDLYRVARKTTWGDRVIFRC